jgi:hypothetical protein
MELFKPKIDETQQHALFKQLMLPSMDAERKVLLSWIDGFIDRDNKFIKEFQTTFESSFWELYLHAILKDLDVHVDFSFPAPDFVCEKQGIRFCLEATIANPEADGVPAYGFGEEYINFDIDFKVFNRKSIIRISNAIISKSRKYLSSYNKYSHVVGKPFVLGLNSFDRPHAHFIGHRGVIAVLYGIYINEEKSIELGLDYVPKEKMDFITKDNGAEIALGFFTTPEYEHISAVIYNPLATWGKVKALSELNEYNRNCFFNAVYTNDNSESLIPEIAQGIPKEKYQESLLDGLYVFHNPYAKYPFPEDIVKNSKVAHITLDEHGNLVDMFQERFLLSRNLFALTTNASHKE